MLKNEIKAALAIMGTVFVPFFAQADQSMSMSQGQQQQQQKPGYVSGEMVRAGQLPGAYSQAAGYMCEDGWDVFLTADYIWWNWSQDNQMSAGISGLNGFSSTTLSLSPDALDPGYASGFQVGLGFNMKGMDDWNFYGEYTWYKNSANGSDAIAGTTTSPAVTAHIDTTSHVSLAYNNADFLLQRSFYFGKKLTSNFYTGLRALWMNRENNATATGTASALSSLLALNLTSLSIENKNTSWALGPKFGFDANWLLGYGVKFLSNISTSVLYTRYTGHVNETAVGTATFVSSFPITNNITLSESNYGTLRSIVETYLGLGWGSYFCDNDFHLDLSIGYDFNIHFNYVTNAFAAGSQNPSNLYLHGLNIQARFDF